MSKGRQRIKSISATPSKAFSMTREEALEEAAAIDSLPPEETPEAPAVEEAENISEPPKEPEKPLTEFQKSILETTTQTAWYINPSNLIEWLALYAVETLSPSQAQFFYRWIVQRVGDQKILQESADIVGRLQPGMRQVNLRMMQKFTAVLRQKKLEEREDYEGSERLDSVIRQASSEVDEAVDGAGLTIKEIEPEQSY